MRRLPGRKAAPFESACSVLQPQEVHLAALVADDDLAQLGVGHAVDDLPVGLERGERLAGFQRKHLEDAVRCRQQGAAEGVRHPERDPAHGEMAQERAGLDVPHARATEGRGGEGVPAVGRHEQREGAIRVFAAELDRRAQAGGRGREKMEPAVVARDDHAVTRIGDPAAGSLVERPLDMRSQAARAAPAFVAEKIEDDETTVEADSDPAPVGREREGAIPRILPGPRRSGSTS